MSGANLGRAWNPKPRAGAILHRGDRRGFLKNPEPSSLAGSPRKAKSQKAGSYFSVLGTGSKSLGSSNEENQTVSVTAEEGIALTFVVRTEGGSNHCKPGGRESDDTMDHNRVSKEH